MLPEVSVEVNHACMARVLVAKGAEQGKRAVLAPVVDKQNFPIAAEPLHHGSNGLKKMRQGFLLVIDGDDHAHLRYFRCFFCRRNGIHAIYGATSKGYEIRA